MIYNAHLVPDSMEYGLHLSQRCKNVHKYEVNDNGINFRFFILGHYNIFI